MTLELLYNRIFPRVFGDRVMVTLAFNQLVLTPVLTLPVAYVTKGVVFGDSLKTALKQYWTDVTQKGLLWSFWKLWTPANYLLFGVVPPEWRITFNASVSFLWTIILSRIANSKNKETSNDKKQMAEKLEEI